MARREAERGFTLIELLVTIFVIGLLCALLLPAVQSAREAARRASCANNLRQVALAVQNYHEAVGCFPMGTPYYSFPTIGVYAGHSLLVAILPQLDHPALFNAINFSQNIYQYANQTVHATSLGVLQCPSDPFVSTTFQFGNAYLDIPIGQFVVAYASYAGCSGTWYHLAPDLARTASLAATDNGIFFANSATRVAHVVDGTSNTLLLGEHCKMTPSGPLPPSPYWWFDGYFGDTLFNAFYPIGYWGMDLGGGGETGYLNMTARSLHPGGANFALTDGSVRFIKKSIQSWPVDAETGLPMYVRGSATSKFVVFPGTTPGVYQALSTRNGREAVGGAF
jgi:prepilin-type N-terminal cleavage/methylation domain-containing protein/prepilin-type processing-associated H-X9-DG protein